MRDIKTLLTILRDHFKEPGHAAGMCLAIIRLFGNGVINYSEYYALNNYIEQHSPPRCGPLVYWWGPGKAAPRIRWLNRQIGPQPRDRRDWAWLWVILVLGICVAIGIIVYKYPGVG